MSRETSAAKHCGAQPSIVATRHMAVHTQRNALVALDTAGYFSLCRLEIGQLQPVLRDGLLRLALQSL